MNRTTGPGYTPQHGLAFPAGPARSVPNQPVVENPYPGPVAGSSAQCAIRDVIGEDPSLEKGEAFSWERKAQGFHGCERAPNAPGFPPNTPSGFRLVASAGWRACTGMQHPTPYTSWWTVNGSPITTSRTLQSVIQLNEG